MLRPLLLVALILGLTANCLADDSPATTIAGRVVDEHGQPVANVAVASFWSANGERFDADGKLSASLKTDDDAVQFWSHVGQMGPWSELVKTTADGTFRVQPRGGRTHHVLAIDAARIRGGLGVVPAGHEGQPITIKLEPLVRVQGLIRGPETDSQPKWTHVYAERAADPERPIDLYRVASCGSFTADFSMLLPPGRYNLHAYNGSMNGEVLPHPEVVITGQEREINLGTLRLSSVPQGLATRLADTRAEKHLKALKDHVGDAPPALFAEDARGVPRDWQLGRSPGKWQLVEFWGMDCTSCLGRSLPDLMKFQDDHQAQADRFEIVTVFLDADGKIRSIAQLDEALKPIIAHVWGGKSLPFPTLVDPTYRTIESFGLSGYGEQVLVNPEGKIVAGDLATLRGILDRK